MSSINDLSSIYSEMKYYDYINNYRKGYNRTSQKYLSELLELRYLLYYQNKNYFPKKSGEKFTPLIKKERELNHCDAINSNFDKDGKMKNTKCLYDFDFYLIYCSYEDIINQLMENKKLFLKYDTPKTQLERLERATKSALNLIGLNTTAKAEGEYLDMDIDLSNIETDLVNLGGHPYNDKGQYKNLVIKIRS